jgi:hypothetical protein
MPALAALLLALAGLGAVAGAPGRAQPQEAPVCFGDTRSLIVSAGMPYTPVRVQGRTGFFVVDLGADISSISPTTFLGGVGPAPLAGSVDRFAGVDFFGPWAPLRLRVQNQSGIRGLVPQAGLIGTDLLREHVLSLDYANGLIHRTTPERFCSDATLRQAGFQPLSSRGYFGRDPARLTCPAAPRRGGCPNIPTIPLRIGPLTAVAQVDTGYSDTTYPPSLNINRALFEQLRRSGVILRPDPSADQALSTCVAGEQEQVRAYRLPAIARCGGIGTWSQAAGQLGASFVNDGTLVVDPRGQRVWFRPPATTAPGSL